VLGDPTLREPSHGPRERERYDELHEPEEQGVVEQFGAARLPFDAVRNDALGKHDRRAGDRRCDVGCPRERRSGVAEHGEQQQCADHERRIGEPANRFSK
jgi:hypothetical protein